MTPQDPYSFTASPFPHGHFRVHAVSGREALSKPYRFDVVVSARSALGEDIERLALGQRAALVIHIGSSPRVIPGVIASVHYQGVRPHEEAVQYTFRLVPSLALLKHQRGSRIFQDKRVPDVVDEVLRGAGMATHWDLTREYPKRSFITQYEESDLTFVTRLLAEAGIFYGFAASAPNHEDFLGAISTSLDLGTSLSNVAAFSLETKLTYPEETVFFGDKQTAYPAIGTPSLYYFPLDGVVTERDKIGQFETIRRVKSTVAEYREYDPDRPHVLLVGRDEGHKEARPNAGFAESLMQNVVHREYETYDHDGAFFFPDRKGTHEAARQIRRQTARKRVSAEGRSAATELAPGYRWKLEDHPVNEYNREHVIISIEHRGSIANGGATYENNFTCVPSDVTYVPARQKRRVVQSLVTATVVGPHGEDIHVDAGGRIKVLFHWDRRRTMDDTASCWIRVVQPWAGAGFGHQFFPRVGMEVVVQFVDGNPDNPPPTLDVLTPADGATIGDHGLLFFTVHATGSNLQNFTVHVDGGPAAPGSIVVSQPAPVPCLAGCDLQIGWDATVVSEGVHLITLEVADDVGRLASDGVTLDFEDVPVVSFTAPSTDLRGVGQATVRVHVLDRGNVAVALATPAMTFTASAADCRTGCDFSWVWNTAALPAGPTAYQVTATDGHGRSATASRTSLLGDLPIVTGIQVSGETDGIGFLEVEVHLVDAQSGVVLGCSGQSQDMEGVDAAGVLYHPMAYFVTPSGARFEPANLAGHDVVARVIEDDSQSCPGPITPDDDEIGRSPAVPGLSLSSLPTSFGRVSNFTMVIGRPLTR